MRAATRQLDGLPTLLGARREALRHTAAHLGEVHRVSLLLTLARALLVQARQGEHIVDKRTHGRCFGANEAGKARHVLRGHDTRLHELSISTDDLQGGLHLVAHVARELATHVVGMLEGDVLRSELTILCVNALEQRLQLAICLVLSGACKVYLAQGPHDMVGQLARHKRRHHDDDHERHGKRHRHATQKGRQRRANLRQAQHRPVAEKDGRIEGVAAQSCRAAQHRGLLLRLGGLHLFAVGMAAQA